MFKGIFSARMTTRADVGLAVTGALFAVFKAWDTSNKYKTEQKALKNKENNS